MFIRFACEHPRVVVLVLASAFLHVKISVKVVRDTLEWSLVFLEHVCAGGGGGNVTFHGIYSFPRDSFIVNISMHFGATLEVACSGCHSDLVSYVRGGAGLAP